MWMAAAVLAAVAAVLLAVTVVLLAVRGGDGSVEASAGDPTAATTSDAGGKPSATADAPAATGAPAPSASGPATPTPPATGSPAAGTPGPQDVVLDPATPYTTFVSPSGNIACALGSADGGAFARCEVGDVTWSVPRPADCELDWGGGENGRGDVSVGNGGVASPVCAGDTVRDPAAMVLPYGSAVRLGDELACRSSEAGVRCENLTSGNGFAVSRADLELF